MSTSFNIFDPSQWANVSGFAVMMVAAVLTVVGALAKLAAGSRWADWLDENHGRASIDDEWEESATIVGTGRRQ